MRDGKVTKGVRFQNNVDVGDPLALARKYDVENIDELVFYDITASAETRGTVVGLIESTSDQVFIPFTAGGGVREVDDFDTLLRAGADKISVNSGAVADPSLIRRAADRFGSQCVVLSVDARRSPQAPSGFGVTSHGGRRDTGLDLIEWVREGQRLGAGELVINSMDADGTRAGFDLELTRAVADRVPIPVIASGGVGNLEHLYQGVVEGGADAVLAASIFHFGEYTVGQARDYLRTRGVPVRR